jgi:hypothetical protein
LLETFEAFDADVAAFDSRRQRTARLALVPAVAEAALAQKGPELPETICDGIPRNVSQAKVADTRRVD